MTKPTISETRDPKLSPRHSDHSTVCRKKMLQVMMMTCLKKCQCILVKFTYCCSTRTKTLAKRQTIPIKKKDLRQASKKKREIHRVVDIQVSSDCQPPCCPQSNDPDCKFAGWRALFNTNSKNTCNHMQIHMPATASGTTAHTMSRSVCRLSHPTNARRPSASGPAPRMYLHCTTHVAPDYFVHLDDGPANPGCSKVCDELECK